MCIIYKVLYLKKLCFYMSKIFLLKNCINKYLFFNYICINVFINLTLVFLVFLYFVYYLLHCFQYIIHCTLFLTALADSYRVVYFNF